MARASSLRTAAIAASNGSTTALSAASPASFSRTRPTNTWPVVASQGLTNGTRLRRLTISREARIDRHWTEIEITASIKHLERFEGKAWLAYIEAELTGYDIPAEVTDRFVIFLRNRLYQGESSYNIAKLLMDTRKVVRGDLQVNAAAGVMRGQPMTRPWTDDDVDRSVETVRRVDPDFWSEYFKDETELGEIDQDISDRFMETIRVNLFSDIPK